jgi:hypothetical protein
VWWEHSLKNELILARRMGPDRHGTQERARQRLQQVLEECHLQELTQRFAA